jgi:hypothetical protein
VLVETNYFFQPSILTHLGGKLTFILEDFWSIAARSDSSGRVNYLFQAVLVETTTFSSHLF